MPRALRPLLALLLLAGALSACDDGNGTATPSPTVTVTVTETPSPEPLPTATASPVDPCLTLVGGENFAFVFVTSPTPGTSVSSGFTFQGCSNAFEAAHSWRLKDSQGAVLSSGFGTATCGTGCVGTFQQVVTYSIAQVQVGTLEVFTTSAEDGSEQDMNSIPVVLQP